MSSRPHAGPPDQVVLVLGASSGIGRSCARAFAARGARVVLVARGATGLAAAERECVADGAAATLVHRADVLDAPAVQAAVDAAVARFGGIDVVVHTANVMAYGTFDEVPVEVFERVVDTAVHGTANVARSALAEFRRQQGGTLVIVTSLLASVPVPYMGSYIAAKWGQLGLVRVLQLEARNTPGVEIATVAPGSVDTPIFRRAANFAGRIGRPPPPVVSPERVARAVVRSADRPRRTRSVGPANGVITLGFRLAPWLFDRLVGPLARVGALGPEPVAPTAGNVFVSADEPTPELRPGTEAGAGTGVR
jgi:NAD(P)-dependent dehydrogenase (short-subunit alcohol dehydrogenase family)